MSAIADLNTFECVYKHREERSKSMDKAKRPQQFYFGSQYFRPPTPPADEWEDDIKRMKDMDFNVIKIWIQWRWVEPVQGNYKFDDFDRIFDLCDKYDMGMVPNTILETPPEWIYLNYPDARVMDIQRQPVYETVYSAYQIGGFRPCWDQPDVAKHSLDCLRRIIDRYKGRKCLVSWDVWNEPVQIFCSCENTRREFVAWLEKRFGSVEACNEFIGRNYPTFNEVPVPFSTDNLPLNYLMTLFMQDRLAEQIGWRAEIVREIDTSVPPMTHCIGPGSSIYRPYADDWKNASVVDFYGSSMHQWNNRFGNPNYQTLLSKFPLCLDAILAASPFYWVSELASGESHYGFSSEIFSKEDIRITTWMCVAHGAKGLMYWQFKPERLGVEAPGWGLVGMDGTILDRTEEAREVAEFSSEWNSFLMEAKPLQDRIGILFDSSIAIQSEAVSVWWQENPYLEALRGVYQALWHNHMAPHVVTAESDWSRIDVLYLPFPIMMTKELAVKIRDYVDGGGTVISEGGLGCYDHRTWFSPTIPGEGLDRLFGVKETEILPDREGMPPFRDSFFEKHYNLDVDFLLADGTTGSFSGALFKRIVQPKEAQVVGTYCENGKPAIFRNNVGKGTTYYLATHPSYHVATTWDEKSMEGIYKLVTSVVDPHYTVTSEGFVTSRVLEKGNERLLFVFNYDETEHKAVFSMKGFANIKCLRGLDKKRDISLLDDKHVLAIKKRDVAVYLLKK